mgnify:CR=1 FL=1
MLGLNRGLTARLLLMVAGSFAFGFALVPLYDVLCDITGFGDQRALTEQRLTVEAMNVAVGAQDFRLGQEAVIYLPAAGLLVLED